MTRLIHTQIHNNIANEVGGKPDHQLTVQEVQQAIQQHAVVIIGMSYNPHPKAAKKLLDQHNIKYKYLEYGGYLSEWKRRGALKMWSGWQTFPMIFVNGILVGGKSDLEKLINSGELTTMLTQ